MLTGAGFLAALDTATPGANAHLGGLLQGATYLSGVSGGLWLVMSNYLHGSRPVLDTVARQKKGFLVPVLHGIANMDVNGMRQKLDSPDVQALFLPPPGPAMSWNSTGRLRSPLTTTFIKSFFRTSNETSRRPDVRETRQILRFYKDLTTEVRPKRHAGFAISFVDYWGRALVRKILPHHKRALATTFSSVRPRHPTQPFPLICLVEREPGTPEDFRSSHIFEFNPFEFGSWDSFLGHFTDLRYLGTELRNGTPTRHSTEANRSICVAGYDNVALVAGTSSSLFNTLIQYVHKLLLTLDAEPTTVVSQLLQMFGVSLAPRPANLPHPEHATFSPNPFYMVPAGRGRSVARSTTLYLADGGDDGQNVPFHLLLVRQRQVDAVFALDCSADLYNFPNGTSLRRTLKRYHASRSGLTIPLFVAGNTTRRIFPKTPLELEFAARNMRSTPIFLGCDLSDYPATGRNSNSNLSSNAKTNSPQFETWENYTPPLIIVAANTNHSYASNTSTFQGIYSLGEVEAMVENGYNIATCGNSTEYMACVACAVAKRSADRQNVPLAPHCQRCFSKYCYR